MRRPHAGPGKVAGRLGHRQKTADGFHESAHIAATPDDILEVVSDPEVIARCLPLPFEFDEPVDRLRAGHSYATVARLAGRHMHSQLQILRADRSHIALRLAGPLIFDLSADLAAAGGGTQADVRAWVHSGGGLSGRLLTGAAAALLRAGALGRTVAAIRREAERR